ncbi:MAG: hypothetical protein IIX48_12365 [Lachnospiraceae bacterium]|nr:hypothetical protein [Lachnospiraceae bacterium]MBQ1173367.1 hypothetical protein [Lachnospiraceae bacterium]
MFDPILSKIQEGLPVLGTCAGLILLAEKLSNDNNVYFGTLPVTDFTKVHEYFLQICKEHKQSIGA